MAEAAGGEVQHYAQRLLNSQNVASGSVQLQAMSGGEASSVPPLHVAAVLHALADHTHNTFMVNQVVDGMIFAADNSDGAFEPRVKSLGRYFHALADQIERQTTELGC